MKYTVHCECGKTFEVHEDRFEDQDQIMCSSCGERHDETEVFWDNYRALEVVDYKKAIGEED